MPDDSRKALGNLLSYAEELMVAARAGLCELAEELRFFGTRQHAVN